MSGFVPTAAVGNFVCNLYCITSIRRTGTQRIVGHNIKNGSGFLRKVCLFFLVQYGMVPLLIVVSERLFPAVLIELLLIGEPGRVSLRITQSAVWSC